MTEAAPIKLNDLMEASGGVQRSLSPEESADASRPSEPNSEGGKP